VVDHEDFVWGGWGRRKRQLYEVVAVYDGADRVELAGEAKRLGGKAEGNWEEVGGDD